MLAAFMGRMPLTRSENSQPNCTQKPIRHSASTFTKAFCPSFFISRIMSIIYDTTSTTPIQPWYAPVVRYLEESPVRLPFGDWYRTEKGEIVHFINRTVQGGIFAPLLKASGKLEQR